MKPSFFLCLIFLVVSVEVYGFVNLAQVDVECTLKQPCDFLKKRAKTLKGRYESLDHLKKNISFIFAEGGYLFPEYQLQELDGIYYLRIRVDFKKKIKSIKLYIDGKESSLISSLESLLDQEYSQEDFSSIINVIKRNYREKGFPHVAAKYTKRIDESRNEIFINVQVSTGPPLILREIKVLNANRFTQSSIKRRLKQHIGEPYSFSELKKTFDSIKIYFSSFGHYLFDYSLVKNVHNNEISIDVIVEMDLLFTFDIRSQEPFARKDILRPIINDLKKYKKVLSVNQLDDLLRSFYRRHGYLNPTFEIKLDRFDDSLGIRRAAYKIVIDKKLKARISGLTFIGNNHFSDIELSSLYRSHAFDLASSGYVDFSYINKFMEILRRHYLRNGFVSPNIRYDIELEGEGELLHSLEFRIEEGPRSFIDEVTINGLESANIDLDDIFKKYNITANAHFNPVEFESFTQEIIKRISSKGFFFVRVTNQDRFVTYNQSATRVSISIDIELGDKLQLGSIIVLGNRKTQEHIIRRRIGMKSGDLITKDAVQKMRTDISSLGLFSNVRVQPVHIKGVDQKTDIFVIVEEREYGSVELAPGYRTDLGYKVSAGLNYKNLGGMNRSISLLTQVNERDNLNTLEPSRREEGKKIIEYTAQINFSDNDIKGWDLDYNLAFSAERRRFYAFDAEILRFGNSFKKYWGDIFATNIRYQYETISQFNASDEKDSGNFQVGAVIPSISVDLRNNKINPTKGALTTLSYEIAHPSFLSQRTIDSEVNYIKTVNRNRFYIPVGNHTIAIYAAFGAQRNMARETRVDAVGNPVLDADGDPLLRGTIPSIKVFRLAGTDIVRGYSEEEINRLDGGQDISEALVQDAVFFSNIKVEPRYFISDNIILGAFFDAGRVFLNSYRPFDLRTSAGISFKYLTPVGSLDFDYGIKLDRQRLDDGRVESPGRLHISIGFF